MPTVYHLFIFHEWDFMQNKFYARLAREWGRMRMKYGDFHRKTRSACVKILNIYYKLYETIYRDAFIIVCGFVWEM